MSIWYSGVRRYLGDDRCPRLLESNSFVDTVCSTDNVRIVPRANMNGTPVRVYTTPLADSVV